MTKYLIIELQSYGHSIKPGTSKMDLSNCFVEFVVIQEESTLCFLDFDELLGLILAQEAKIH